MVQIFETQHQPSALELFAQGLGGGLSQEIQAQRESDRKLQNLQREMQLYQPYLNDLSQGVERKLNEGLTGENQEQNLGNPQQQGQQQPQQQQQGQPLVPPAQRGLPKPPNLVPPVTDLGKRLNEQQQKKYENELNQHKISDKRFEQERKYHTEFSKPAEEKVNATIKDMPQQLFVLENARNAVETGELGSWSKDHWANILPAEMGKALRSPEGASLETLSKFNLVGSLRDVTARAQNMYMEKIMRGAFAEIGKSKEANLAAHEVLEGGFAEELAHAKEFAKLANEDMQNFGYVRKDIDRRASDAAWPEQKRIMERTAYRTKELEENVKTPEQLEKSINKKVTPGTPLTSKMGKVFAKKFGSYEKGIEEAQKRGYSVPSDQDFELYTLPPNKFLESLRG
jgi:hypothetical protein